MKFHKGCKIEGIMSSDATRHALTHARLDVVGRRLIATDGHCAVILPVEVHDADTSGSVSGDAIKAARRAKTNEITCASALEVAGGATYPREDGSGFPDIDRVRPAFAPGGAGTHTIDLDAETLARIAAAMDCALISITCDLSDPRAPLLILPEDETSAAPGAIGVLMPVVQPRNKSRKGAK